MQRKDHIENNFYVYRHVCNNFSEVDKLIYQVIRKDAINLLRVTLAECSQIEFTASMIDNKLYYKDNKPLVCNFVGESHIFIDSSIWRSLQKLFPENIFKKYVPTDSFYKRGPGIRIKNQFVSEIIYEVFGINDRDMRNIVGMNKHISKTLRGYINETKCKTISQCY